jgi:hypothetical protein
VEESLLDKAAAVVVRGKAEEGAINLEEGKWGRDGITALLLQHCAEILCVRLEEARGREREGFGGSRLLGAALGAGPCPAVTVAVKGVGGVAGPAFVAVRTVKAPR